MPRRGSVDRGLLQRASFLVAVPRVCLSISFELASAFLTRQPKMASIPHPTVIVGVTLASSDMTRALSRSFRIRGTVACVSAG